VRAKRSGQTIPLSCVSKEHRQCIVKEAREVVTLPANHDVAIGEHVGLSRVMAATMITATVVGQQVLKDDLLCAVAGSMAHVGTGTAEATIAEQDSGDVRVVVNAAPASGIATVDDLLILVCSFGDQTSVSHLADRAWKFVDQTPYWQPITLMILHGTRASDVASSRGHTGFTGALRELEAKLDRDPRYAGCHHVTLSSERTSATAPNAIVLAEALLVCVDLVKTPTHVVYDRRAESFTLTGERCLRRAFWLLDQDVDGYLSDAEVLLWYNKMFDNATEDDVAVVKKHLKDLEAQAAAVEHGSSPQAQQHGDADERSTNAACQGRFVNNDFGVTVDGFLSVCLVMLREGRASVIWALLGDTGIGHDGNPFPTHSLDRVPFPDQTCCVQLSLNGTRFFAGLYSKRRFVQPTDLWTFTPECPWDAIPGMPTIDNNLDSERFVAAWKTMTVLHPAAVAEFAFFWGYKSDPALLFVVKPTREHRKTERDWPSTLQVAVIGTEGTGKSELLARIGRGAQDGDGAADDVATVLSSTTGRSGPTVVPVTVPYNGEPTTLVLREVPEASAFQFVNDPTAMAQVDGVLLCFTGSDDFSLDFMYDIVPHLVVHTSLPIALVLTKADLPVSEQPRKVPPPVFLQKHGLPWCPFATSTFDERLEALGIANDVDTLAVTLVDAIHCVDATRVPRVSTARKIRRVFIVATGIAIVGLVVKRLLRARGSGSGSPSQ
jgi:hypothetical protein